MGRVVITASIYNKRNKLIARASNSFHKTHPLQAKYACKCGEPYKQYLHAEVLAIIRAKGKGYRIHVERYNREGKPLLAMPCPICMLAIREAGIQVVSFTI
jgi:tRNA(Arg) A34 adenosine deaminase TadA